MVVAGLPIVLPPLVATVVGAMPMGFSPLPPVSPIVSLPYAVTEYVSGAAKFTAEALHGVWDRVSSAAIAHPITFPVSYLALLGAVSLWERWRGSVVRHAPSVLGQQKRERYFPHLGTLIMYGALTAASAEMVVHRHAPRSAEFMNPFGDALVAGAFIALIKGIDRSLLRARLEGGQERTSAGGDDYRHISKVRRLEWAMWVAWGLCLIDDATHPLLFALRHQLFATLP